MRGMPQHPLYDVLAKHLPDAPGTALELGCGTGQGCEFFLERGWRVVAIDIDSRAVEATRERVGDQGRVELIQGDIVDTPFEASEAIAAGFVLFFLNAEQFAATWRKISQALRSGGVLLVQFLGPNDDWATQDGLSHDGAEIQDLLSEYDVLHHEEVDRDGKTAWGESKHWHVHHVIARKR